MNASNVQLSLWDLPRELRDSIYDFAIEARAAFAYGYPRHAMNLLDPSKQLECTDPGETLVDDAGGFSFVFKSRLVSSTASLLRTNKRIAAEAEHLLCREELRLFVDDINKVRGWTFKPSAKFERLLRRSQFVLGCSAMDAVVFLNQLPRSTKQYITSIVLSWHLLNDSLEQDGVSLGHHWQHWSESRSLKCYEEVVPSEAYWPISQVILNLPSLREVAVQMMMGEDGNFGLYNALLGDLCHALYWSSGHLQIIYWYASDVEPESYLSAVIGSRISPPHPDGPIGTEGHPKLPIMPAMLDVYYYRARIRGVGTLEWEDVDWDDPLARTGEMPPCCGLWTDFPEADKIFILTRPADGRRHESMPRCDDSDEVWREYLDTIPIPGKFLRRLREEAADTDTKG